MTPGTECELTVGRGASAARPRPRAGNVSRAAGPLAGPEAEDNVAAKRGSWTAAEEVARESLAVEATRARRGLGDARPQESPDAARGCAGHPWAPGECGELGVQLPVKGPSLPWMQFLASVL